jgi:hypothetical protein
MVWEQAAHRTQKQAQHLPLSPVATWLGRSGSEPHFLFCFQFSIIRETEEEAARESSLVGSLFDFAGSWELDVKEATSSWVGIYKVFWWLCSEVK